MLNQVDEDFSYNRMRLSGAFVLLGPIALAFVMDGDQVVVYLQLEAAAYHHCVLGTIFACSDTYLGKVHTMI